MSAQSISQLTKGFQLSFSEFCKHFRYYLCPPALCVLIEVSQMQVLMPTGLPKSTVQGRLEDKKYLERMHLKSQETSR